MSRKSSRIIPPVPEATEQELLGEEPLDNPDDDEATAEGRMSKAGAARETLAAGVTLPREASVYIKQKYGIDITPQQFSAEKSRLKQRSGGVLPSPAFPNSPRPLNSYLAPPRLQDSTEPNLLEAMETMKPLIARLGADTVKRMVDLLG